MNKHPILCGLLKKIALNALYFQTRRSDKIQKDRGCIAGGPFDVRNTA